MEFVAVRPEIDRYLDNWTREKDPILQEMERRGNALDFPIVGPQVGRLLFLLTKGVGAKRIFEMGSGFGYSAYWFAKALPAGGRVYQTEGSKENSEMAKDFFIRGGLSKKSEFLVGDALQGIDRTKGLFDIIFIDIDKEKYPAAFQKAKGRIRKGGLLLADNLLWFGKVLEKRTDPQTKGIQEFTRLLFGDPDFFATILPIRDGVGIGYRK